MVTSWKSDKHIWLFRIWANRVAGPPATHPKQLQFQMLDINLRWPIDADFWVKPLVQQMAFGKSSSAFDFLKSSEVALQFYVATLQKKINILY